MDFKKTAFLLREKNCMNEQRKFIYGYNRTKIHNQYETFEHYMAKAALVYLIFKKKMNVISEAEMNTGRVVDVLQICKNGDLVGYECESGKNNKLDIKGVDIVDVPLNKMPEFAKDGIFELKKWLEQYLIG